MATIPTDKYYLRSIHEEIALFDRKLAHVEKFEKFATDEERDLAVRKMTTKRKALVTIALRLAAEGVEFKPAELPRSLRSKEEAMAVEAVVEEPKVEHAEVTVNRSARRQNGSPYAGTVLDWQASIAHYMEKKHRA